MATEKVSEVYVLQNMGITPDYKHTIYFASREAQVSYMKSKVRVRGGETMYWDQLSYIRPYGDSPTGGHVDVPIREGRFYNCNYIMFSNASSKWFYAFLDYTEYISDRTTRLHFTIDVIQTFMFGEDGERAWQFHSTFVEREHVMSDSKWSNLMPEPIDLGETTFLTQGSSIDAQDWATAYIIQFRKNSAEQEHDTGTVFVNGSMMGGSIAYAATGAQAKLAIDKLQEIKDDNIISVQCIPRFFGTTLTTAGAPGLATPFVINTEYKTQASGQLKFTHDDINGYKPRNNKCFNYPYYCLYVSNQAGAMALYDFAFMSASARETWQYDLYTDLTLNAPIILHPKSYKGLGSKHDYDIQLGTLPSCQFASDYSVAMAQAQANARNDIVLGLLGNAHEAYSSLKGAGVQAGLGDGYSAIANGGSAVGDFFSNSVMGVINGLTTMNRMSAQQANTPNVIHNLTGCDQLGMKIWNMKPVFALRVLKAEFLRALDDFFDMYGYAVNEFKSPNISGRPQWNYVKTNNCCIKGIMPAPAMQLICAIHDNGITYWKNGDNIGNYSLDNSL